MLGITHNERKRPCHFPRAWGLVPGSACSGGCCLGYASSYSSSWHKGAGADMCMQCTVNHAISILNVWKCGWTFSSWHPHSSQGEPCWSISFRVFSTSYYQCCWTGWRGAWSLDEGERFGVLFCPGPELQLGMWISTRREIGHVWAKAQAWVCSINP